MSKASKQKTSAGESGQLSLAPSAAAIDERLEKLKRFIGYAKQVHEEFPEITVIQVLRLLDPQQKKTATLSETAVMLGQAEITIYRLAQKKKLRPLKSLRHKIFPLAEIDRFLERDLDAA